jgi:internalin A
MTALELIEREKTERTGHLDISYTRLTELPDLSELIWLKTLIVSNLWGEYQENTWLESRDTTHPNKIPKAKPEYFPPHLEKLIWTGNFDLDLNISDASFLKKLTELRWLDLSHNNIKDLSFLEKMTNLKILDIGSNKISDASQIKNLIDLEILDLGENQIIDGYFLQNLVNLKSLDISGNKLRNYNVLTNLSSLEKLVLRNNGVRNWAFLEKLPCLKLLSLAGSQLRKWDFLSPLTNLETLHLRSCNIENIAFLENLTNLRALHLSYNRIHNLAPMNKLIKLNELDLEYNQITDCSGIGNLLSLSILELSGNPIKDAAFLEKLTTLNKLKIENTKVRDWSFLCKLTNLAELSLERNEITDVSHLSELIKLKKLNLEKVKVHDWAFLSKLTNLFELNLNENMITNASFLINLKNLRELTLARNQISDGAFLSKLPNLTNLDLSFNRISDVSFLENLTKLGKIDLSFNQIKNIFSLPSLIENNKLSVTLIRHFRTQKRVINLDGNPLINPPKEIVSQGNKAILEYFKLKEKLGSRPLLEAKLVLLGDGRAGKTSLARRLLVKELPTEADRTLGVDIVIGEYLFPVSEGDFKLHLWDFAGQDKYKPLHQFFYTEGAVYVMVADSGNALTDFDDWFQTAELFGEGSPLVLTLNEFKDGIGMGAFDEERWMKQFPKLIKEVHLVNLFSGKGFQKLETCIRYYAQQLTHAKVEYPTNWANIRAELERRRNENYISEKDYLSICRKNELPEKASALILSSILHKIGVCLHYQKSDLLKQIVILKNEWATQAVYQILEDQEVANTKKGFFDHQDLKRIWSHEDYADMRPQLLELMQQFKMVYPLPNRKEFVAPTLLPAAPPSDWDLPNRATDIEIFVEYKFLPKALLTGAIQNVASSCCF